MIWLAAILSGLLTTLIVRLTTNVSALRAAVRTIHADLLEFRLYFDEPTLIWQAQLSLVRDNLRLFLLFLPPLLILALPMTWLMLQLDAVYGHRPLHPGEAAVFTVQLTRPLSPNDRIGLRGRAGVKVETPPIRIERDRQVSWRIRPESGGGVLDLTLNGRTFEKSVGAGDFLRLPKGEIAWMKIDYPKSEATIPWLVWFLIVSTVAALLSARASRRLRDCLP